MKFQGKKLYIFIIALILGAVMIPNAAAEQFDDPDILIGEWTIHSMFSILGSEEEIDIDLAHTEPDAAPLFIFEPDGTGTMQSFGASIPFTWDIVDADDAESGEIALMSIEALETTMKVYIISEAVLSTIESEGDYASMAILERIFI
jgi:hypothetical protein